MSRTVFDAIKHSGRLPSPTGIVLEVLRLAEDPNSTVQRLTETLEKDTALSARLLRIANCPLTGLTRQVASVQQAVVLLGRAEVSRLALCFCLVEQNRAGCCAGFNYDWFWSDSLGRATTARIVARYLREPGCDEAFTAALLSQLGRLAFASIFPAAYAKILATAASDGLDVVATLEVTEFGLDHAALAGEMLNEWRLPPRICEAIARQRSTDDDEPAWTPNARSLARILELSGLVSSILTGCENTSDVWSKCVMHANRLGLPVDAFRERFDLIREQWREAGTVLAVTTRDVPSADVLQAQANRVLSQMTADCEAALQSRPCTEGAVV